MSNQVKLFQERFEDFEVHPRDIDADISTEERIFLKKFESCWKKFMKDNPRLQPRGRRASRLAALNKEVQETIESQEKAGSELQKQLEFFEDSRESLEETYASEVEYAKNLQKIIHDRLSKQLDGIAKAEHLMEQTVPWEYFLEAADMKSIPYVGVPADARGIKPSARALALITPNGDADDVKLRAMRMDHALLTTQMLMLEKESERIDLTNESLEVVGKFLTEHNIWGILTEQQEKRLRIDED